MPEGDLNPNPEPTELDALKAALKAANDEAAGRRRDLKAAKDANDKSEARFKVLLESVGASTDEEFAERIGELRAAADEKKQIPEGVDVKALMRDHAKLQADFKKVSGERDAAVKEGSDTKQSLVRFRVNDELTKGFSQHEVRAEYHDALRATLSSNVRLNDQGEPVWVVKDKTGADFDEVAVADGLKGYFETNPVWLPAKATPGSGSTASIKPAAGRVTTVEQMFPANGDLTAYKASREGLGIAEPAKK